MGCFYEWMFVEVAGKSGEVWVLDRSSFFLLSPFLKHCFIHTYHCHANGLGVFLFLNHFLLENRVVGLGVTKFHSNRGSPFLFETRLEGNVFLEGLFYEL